MHRLHHLPDGKSFAQIDLFFSPKTYSGTIQNNEPHKCDEVKFYPIKALPETTESFIRQALECILNGKTYSEIGWNTIHPQSSLKAIENAPHKAYEPNIYETTSQAYDFHRKADPELVDHFMHYLQPHEQGNILDIGCGSGNYTIALAARGLPIEGIDLSPSMLAKAKNKCPRLIWTQGDMRSLPFGSDQFSGAITINTLHYVREELPSVFKEIRRVIKPGGNFVCYAIALEQCLQFWLGHYFPFFRESGRKNLAPQNIILEALSKAGFTDIQAQPFFVSEKTSDFFTYACKYRPHLFLEPQIRAGMTPLQLPEYSEEVKVGCERLQHDIQSGAIYRVIAEHESRLGEGLLISAKK